MALDLLEHPLIIPCQRHRLWVFNRLKFSHHLGFFYVFSRYDCLFDNNFCFQLRLADSSKGTHKPLSHSFATYQESLSASCTNSHGEMLLDLGNQRLVLSLRRLRYQRPVLLCQSATGGAGATYQEVKMAILTPQLLQSCCAIWLAQMKFIWISESFL